MMKAAARSSTTLGNGSTGVLSSTAVGGLGSVLIRGGCSARCTTGGQVVSIPDSGQPRACTVTVLALVRGSASPGQWRYVVSKGAMGCTAGSYGLYSGFGGGMAFYVYGGSAFYVSPEAPTSVWNGKWHVVAGTFDGTTVRLFVDGTEVGTGTTVPIPTWIAYGLPSDTAGMGAYGGCDLSLVGDIDEVSIWSAALPVGQIFPKAQALLGSSLR
jgi:hypothetical protein